MKKAGRFEKCDKCGGKTLRGKFEGFSVSEQRHFTMKLGRYCKKCNTLYVNPEINPQIVIDSSKYYQYELISKSVILKEELNLV